MSWEQLRSIVQQDRADREFLASQPPQACPNDGTPLVQAPPSASGVELFCPHDGYQWPRDRAQPGEAGG
jgi:hypothetical protein